VTISGALVVCGVANESWWMIVGPPSRSAIEQIEEADLDVLLARLPGPEVRCA
jgi:hypothetical protein